MKLIVLSLAVAALAAPTMTLAQGREEQAVSVPVAYGDLDLSRPGQAAILLQRVDRAALEACGADTASLRELKLSVRQSECYRTNVEQAVAAVHAPAVTALYGERSTSAAGQ